MRVPVTLAVATLAVLALTTAVYAVDMYTPPLFAEGSDFIECKIANVSAAKHTVQIQLIDQLGAVLKDSGPISLPAGLIAHANLEAPGFAICKFIVGATTTSVRASGSVFLGSGDFSDVTFVAAQ